MQIYMEPIGYVENDIDSPVDFGWEKVESSIVLRKNLSSALSGLSEFSHIIVIFWMHLAKSTVILARKPQNRKDMPEVGILAQRAKHRPNPIGITTVPLVKISGYSIIVRGLNAINDTPVLDIKPYYHEYDNQPEAKVPEWVGRLMQGYF
ncbi:tRNA (N6-threonylcarbamoyladenosine(37)-N6)-methyltransferase TrmO [Chloroflexota bacterium]